MAELPLRRHVEVVMRRLSNFIRWTALDGADNLRILGIMLSVPQDSLHLISPRRISICETRSGGKETPSLKSRGALLILSKFPEFPVRR